MTLRYGETPLNAHSDTNRGLGHDDDPAGERVKVVVAYELFEHRKHIRGLLKIRDLDRDVRVELDPHGPGRAA